MSKLFTYFKNKYDIKEASNGWHRFVSPFYDSDSSPSIGVNFDTSWVHDFRTGYSASVWEFIKEAEQCDFKEAKSLVESGKATFKIPKQKNKLKGKLKLPDNCKPLNRGTCWLAARAKKFLTKRGLRTKGIFYCDQGQYFGRIIIPIIITGKLEYYIARTVINQEPKYLNLEGGSSSDIFYNEDALLIHEEINLVEGWSDADTLGKNTIASLGWNLSMLQIMKLIHSPCKKLTIIADKGFFHQQCGIGVWFAPHKHVRVVNIDPICTKNKKDVNDLGKKKVKKLIKKTAWMTYERLAILSPLPF